VKRTSSRQVPSGAPVSPRRKRNPRPRQASSSIGKVSLSLAVPGDFYPVGGLGGCPYAPGTAGNIATEELVHMVEGMGVATGIDLAAMIDAAADAERIIGGQLPSQVLRAGPRTHTIPA
jgi:hydroxymethylglutaryl-CoA lyase